MSPESEFEVKSLQDFLESLHILGFYRSSLPERSETNHLCYKFMNPWFVAGEAIPNDLYKHLADPEGRTLKGTKRLRSKSILLLQRLLQMKSKAILKMSKLEFAQLRLKFELQKQIDLLYNEPNIIEVNLVEPDYVKSGEIAGYYGDVTAEELKACFQNYLPIFHEETDNALEAESDKMQVSEVTEVKSERIPEPKIKQKYTKKIRDEFKESQEAIKFLEDILLKSEEWKFH